MSSQVIPAGLDELWLFFSDPMNLAKITPPSMDFRVTSTHQGSSIYAGQIIEYKVRPVFGISVYWMTEITHVKPGEYFVDEQRYGPYSLWHHQHHFKKIDGGVEMTDIVHYKIPFGVFGKLAGKLFVKKKLEEIFEYRREVIEKTFGKWGMVSESMA
ncbi:MAG: SRPBCC family protein [Chitinophagaceae bacterium]|nr:SRPBCC family protein [Chitinophagaceae bacterium]